MRLSVVALAFLVLSPAVVSAEWQVKPFFGATFGGTTTLVDYAGAAGNPHVLLGIGGVWLGEVIGIETDLGYARGFFQSGDNPLVIASSVTTLTGNIVIALPRRMTQYTLRPYFVGGAGLAHAGSELTLGAPGVSSTLPAMDVGGGVTGFLSKRIGLGWDVRYFRSIGRGAEVGQSISPEQLAFWRANMAIVIRY